MRNKRFNKELLSEEIKKFKILSEYAFYEDKTEDNPDNLILGNNMFEEDEEETESHGINYISCVLSNLKESKGIWNVLEKKDILKFINNTIDLSKTENIDMLKIIESFNLNEDKTLHRNDIVKLIWKNIAIHPNTLDVHIYNLRKNG